jgi:serine/threonine protein kinase
MKPTVGQYKVLERLGRGALGDVFRARDTRAGRTVALVQTAPELTASPARRAHFLEAARRAATLNHPNIAMLFEVLADDDGCYLAYEFAAGPSLRDEMGGAALPPRQALHLAAQIADALAEGHGRGIVHGDLRPDTIVVTPKGSVKVLNFGLTSWTAGGVARAKAAAAPDAIEGDDAQVAGYLSPEQALGAPADPRSDLFAFGVVLYEMLTGRQPFAATTPGATLTNVLGHAAPRPSAVDRGLPAEMDQVVMRLLAKTPDGRYQRAAAAAIDIRRLAVDLDSRLDETTLEPPAPRKTGRRVAPWVALFAGLTLAAAIWHYLRP